MERIKIQELDHIVLNVTDINRSLKFYTDVLGLPGERVAEFQEKKVGFPSVRINDRTIIDLFPEKGEPPGKRNTSEKIQGNLNHFCMVISKEDFANIVEYLKERGVQIRQGPISRWGARGRATSVYFLDPDANEIELRCY